MADVFKEYKIPHAGLKKEIHSFKFELDEKFFANFENDSIHKCNVIADIKFDKQQEPYSIEIDLDGIIWSDCDRCTASIPITVHASFFVYVKYASTEKIDDFDELEIIYISRDESTIDISQILYEYLVLSIPIHKICDAPGKTTYCDLEIIQILEDRKQIEEEENTEKTTQQWAALDKLKDKLN